MDELQISKKLADIKPDIMNKDHYLVSEVLLPLINDGQDIKILFEVRARELHSQPGEICFPGGHVEQGELLQPGTAAMRETMEELGLSASDIKPLGTLDRLVTPMGMLICPFVGQILNPKTIIPNRAEVAEIFTIPLSFLKSYQPQASCVEIATRYGPNFPIHRIPDKYKGDWAKRWSFPAYIYEYKNYFIFGLTALILHRFLDIIFEE